MRCLSLIAHTTNEITQAEKIVNTHISAHVTTGCCRRAGGVKVWLDGPHHVRWASDVPPGHGSSLQVWTWAVGQKSGGLKVPWANSSPDKIYSLLWLVASNSDCSYLQRVPLDMGRSIIHCQNLHLSRRGRSTGELPPPLSPTKSSQKLNHLCPLISSESVISVDTQRL